MTGVQTCALPISLASVTRSHLAAFAELAGAEWLEGDVSASAARRKLLADAFENIDILLQNWTWLVLHWEPDTDALGNEADRCTFELSTGALIQAAVEAGLSRGQAHELLRQAVRDLIDDGDWGSDFIRDPGWLGAHLTGRYVEGVPWPLTKEQSRDVIESVMVHDSIGEIDTIIERVVTTAEDRHQFTLDLGELGRWVAELR